MFITPAYADTTTTTGTVATPAGAEAPVGINGLLQSTPIVPFFLVCIVFYFMLIRPQNKRAQEHRDMIKGLQKGDKVVTGGGLIATVKKVINDDEVVLELSEGVQVTALRSTIMSKKV